MKASGGVTGREKMFLTLACNWTPTSKALGPAPTVVVVLRKTPTGPLPRAF